MAREFKAFVRAKKVKTPQQLLRVVFYTAAWISRFGKPPPTSHCCTSRLRTRRLRSAWPPVGRGCRRYWRKCCIPMLSPRSQRPGVSWSSTAVTSKALVLRGPSIACTSVWTWCSYNLWRLPSRISIPAKASSTSRWGLGILRWRTVAMPMPPRSSRRSRNRPRSSSG